MSQANRPLTPWESVLKTVVGALIENLPNIIRNGYSDGGTKFPPYTNVPLPDLTQYNTGQALALCPLLHKAVSPTLLTVSEGRANGLDTIASFGEISFPEQDVKLSVPLLFREISVTGKWRTESQCQRGSATPVTTPHFGTFVVRYRDVQATLEVTLDQRASSATAVIARLTDGNGMWRSQPDFDPEKDMTFDDKTTMGQRTVLTTMLNTLEVRSKFRDPVKDAIESDRFTDDIRKVINIMLDEF